MASCRVCHREPGKDGDQDNGRVRAVFSMLSRDRIRGGMRRSRWSGERCGKLNQNQGLQLEEMGTDPVTFVEVNQLCLVVNEETNITIHLKALYV